MIWLVRGCSNYCYCREGGFQGEVVTIRAGSKHIFAQFFWWAGLTKTLYVTYILASPEVSVFVINTLIFVASKTKFPQQLCVSRPFLFHLDPEFKVNFATKKVLNILSRLLAYVAKHFSVMTDDYPLL